ncbi:hypothetical protein LTS10_011199 [Elasticomyces elasticus]|nr:hypothetical protein LTS10_011199 [Elasticomyces elasticus]
MLHSNFWQHGAGDLDLPPWAVSMYPMPPDLPLKRCDSPRHDTVQATEPAVAGDGPFLDFLYPPQALALLKRSSGHQWERRNATRLPEGFVQASRGYASQARGRGPRTGRSTDESAVHETEKIGDTRASPVEGRYNGQYGKVRQKESHRPKDEMESEASVRAERLLSEVNDGRKMKSNTTTSISVDVPIAGSHYDIPSATEFSDSPGDLAEAESRTTDRLHGMLAQKRRVAHEDPTKQLAATQRVVELYDSLDAARQHDVRLRVEMISWLSLQRNSEADVRCAALYHALPVKSRTLEVYQSALAVFLRRGLHVHAVKLHREALKNIQNGIQVTKTFFAYAVDEHRWQLAMNVHAQYRLQNAQGPAGEELFWLQVSETPQLVRKALRLANHVKGLHKALTINEQVRRFSGRFYAEALIQEFETNNTVDVATTYDAKGIPQGSIGHLFELLDHLDDDAPRFYERLILSLVTQKRANYQYPRMHRIVSYAYLVLRKMQHRIAEGVLMALLNTLSKYWARLRIQHWRKHHGMVSKAGMLRLLSWYASSGRQASFNNTLTRYKENYPVYEDQKAVLASTIYLHARRCDLLKAQAAFDEAVNLTAQHDEIPPLACWNVLIHAYSRVDDLEGGLDRLHALVDKGLKPDEFSFHPVMQMLAKRGDVEGVSDLIAQYDALAQKKREVAFTGSLLTALVNSDGIDEAEDVLKDAIKEVKTGQVRGSLTGSFNIVLTGHALRRDIDATMRTYRWMKTEGIRMNGNTYAALISALTTHRQTDAAYKILTTVMQDEMLEPTGFHYALVMTGYVNAGRSATALEVHAKMREYNIQPTVSSNAIFLKARALQEREKLTPVHDGKYVTPLNQTINDLRNVLNASSGRDLASKEPGHGRGLDPTESAIPAAYINFLIYVHGRRRCFVAVKLLYNDYLKKLEQYGGENKTRPPLPLLAALMTVHLRAKEYSEVEECWEMAREQADQLAKVVPVSQLKSANVDPAEIKLDVPQLQPPASSDAQEVGFQITSPLLAEQQPPPDDKTISTQAVQALVTEGSQQPSAPKLSPARQHILSRPLRFYMYALAAQNRTADLLSTVAKLFGQGYTLDNRTWNVFIELLCQASPPLVLLAFTLTERFLIPHFPGWAPVSASGAAHTPNPSAKVEGLEYIRARYLRPGQLMPQYRTLVTLGSALLNLRRTEATGRGRQEHAEGMEKYVGTVRQVRLQAPKTVFAVQSMPTVDDALQNKLLRRSR